MEDCGPISVLGPLVRTTQTELLYLYWQQLVVEKPNSPAAQFCVLLECFA